MGTQERREPGREQEQLRVQGSVEAHARKAVGALAAALGKPGVLSEPSSGPLHDDFCEQPHSFILKIK